MASHVARKVEKLTKYDRLEKRIARLEQRITELEALEFRRIGINVQPVASNIGWPTITGVHGDSDLSAEALLEQIEKEAARQNRRVR